MAESWRSVPNSREKLSPRDRLLAVNAHPGGGFYTPTIVEANAVLEILDSNQDITTMLFAIEDQFQTYAKISGKPEDEALQAGVNRVHSKLHCYGDSLANATQSGIALGAVKYVIDTADPGKPIRELLEDSLIGVPKSATLALAAPLARFAILDQYAGDKKKRPAGFDPLRTSHNRNEPQLWRPGAHKRFEDAFTGHDPSVHALRAIEKFLAETYVHEARLLLPRARADVEVRYAFFSNRLKSVRGRRYGPLAKYIHSESTSR